MTEIGMTNNHQLQKKEVESVAMSKNDQISSSFELKMLNKSSIDIEILWITISHERMNKICVATVYRRHQGNIKTNCDILEEQIIFLKEKYTNDPEIFIMGDCNIDYLRPRDPNTKSLKWIEQATGLRQLIKKKHSI